MPKKRILNIEVFQNFYSKNPVNTVPFLQRVSQRMDSIVSIYKPCKLRNYNFLPDCESGYKSLGKQKETIIMNSESLSLDSHGIFGVVWADGEFEGLQAGKQLSAKVFGRIKHDEWMILELKLTQHIHDYDEHEWMVYYTPEKTQIIPIKLDDLVVECNPQLIWRAMKDYINSVFLLQRNHYRKLKLVKKKFENEAMLIDTIEV